jgi:hypothetical protein
MISAVLMPDKPDLLRPHSDVFLGNRGTFVGRPIVNDDEFPVLGR